MAGMQTGPFKDRANSSGLERVPVWFYGSGAGNYSVKLETFIESSLGSYYRQKSMLLKPATRRTWDKNLKIR